MTGIEEKLGENRATTSEQRFLEYLSRLARRRNRAALAQLRRGLGRPPGSAPEMYQYVVPWTANLPAERERCYYTVASLFAWHPVHSVEPNFGTSLAALAKATGNRTTIERHFALLLESHAEQLPDRLRHVIGRLRAQGIGLDWTRLLVGLIWWEHPNRTTQRRWARGFWGAFGESPEVDEVASGEVGETADE